MKTIIVVALLLGACTKGSPPVIVTPQSQDCSKEGFKLNFKFCCKQPSFKGDVRCEKIGL